MDIKKKLCEFINEINNNKQIVMDDNKNNSDLFEIPDYMIDDDIKFIQENSGIKISERDKDFLKISGFSICWDFTNEKNEFIYGGLSINGYIEALVQCSDFWDVYNSLNRHTPNDDELDFLKKLNWFEKQAWGDDGKFGCFLREPGDFPPQIYFYDSGAYFPIRLSLEEYFEAMINSCAVRGWQYFYIDFPEKFPDLNEVNKAKVLAELERTVTVMPVLFPDRDFSFHLKRFAEIKEKLK